MVFGDRLWPLAGQKQVVDVKLWKSGKHAPLTEEGYWLVASDPRDSEMQIYIIRVLESLGLQANDAAALNQLLPKHSGTQGVSSLQQLKEDLRNASWVGPRASGLLEPSSIAT